MQRAALDLPYNPTKYFVRDYARGALKNRFRFYFFILGTFLVLKGGWGTPKVGRVEYSIRKVIGRCVGNLGNIVCTSNPNNGQGHQNAQGLAAMRAADPWRLRVSRGRGRSELSYF